jgi:biotin carboxyl carrier protein
MADVTRDTTVADPTRGDGYVRPTSPPPSVPGSPDRVAERRAVRARLAATSSLGGEAPLRLAPARDEPDDVVSAQRHPEVDGSPRDVALVPRGGDRYLLRDGERHTRVVVGRPARTADGSVREVLVDGFRFEVEVVPDRRAALRERATRIAATGAASGPLDVRAIIPGKIVSVAVQPGDQVLAGQQLLVVEAMKMQNELRAPRDGTIDRVGVAPGVNIEVGDILVVIS